VETRTTSIAVKQFTSLSVELQRWPVICYTCSSLV